MEKPNNLGRVPLDGIETKFNDGEIHLLKLFFQCKNVEELTRAARRYEDLFFRYDLMPYDHPMMLALELADMVYENWRNTDEELRLRHRVPNAGRRRKITFPDDISARIEELVKSGKVRTRLLAIKLLQRTRVLPDDATPSSLLREIQKYEKDRRERWAQLLEDFKDLDLSEYGINK